MVKIDDEVIALEVVRRADKKFVFEITRDNRNRLIATSDEHKTARRAARAGKPIWKRTAKAALKEKLSSITGKHPAVVAESCESRHPEETAYRCS